jgi:hypothetical protein
MTSFRMAIFIDEESLQKVKGLMAWELAEQKYFRIAMGETLDELEYYAQEWMWAKFENPQGPLEDAFEKAVYGPREAEIDNPMPYAWRREKGFTGMTDSLGRYFAWDGGIAYISMAIANSWHDVELIWQLALDYTLKEASR